MKVLFLDIDGVINSHEWCELNPFCLGWEGWKRQIDPALLSLLNQIVEATGASVVLSSTWRFSWTAESITELFRECGGTFPVDDVTPPTIRGRADAIYAWLDGKEVEWLALDDNPELTELGARWIEIPDGLTEEHVENLIHIDFKDPAPLRDL